MPDLMEIHFCFIFLSKMLRCLLINLKLFFFHFFGAENVSIQKLCIVDYEYFEFSHFFWQNSMLQSYKKNCNKKKLIYCLYIDTYGHKYNRNSYDDCLYCDKIEKIQNDDYDEKNMFADSVFAESAVFFSIKFE